MPVDISDLMAGLDGLDKMKESLARRMGVSAGVIVRDEAKENVITGDRGPAYQADWKTGSSVNQDHVLADALYLAYNEKLSVGGKVVYSVSWNSEKAFWGVFKEFGFEMEDVVAGNPDIGFWTLKGKKREDGPLRVEATPFLAPALDENIARILQAALDRGKAEFSKLLQEHKK